MADVREVLADNANKSWADVRYDMQKNYFSTYGVYMSENEIEATLGFDVASDGDDSEEASMAAINDQESVEELLENLKAAIDEKKSEKGKQNKDVFDIDDFDEEAFDEEESMAGIAIEGMEVTDSFLADVLYSCLLYNLGKITAEERENFVNRGNASRRLAVFLSLVDNYDKVYTQGLMKLYNRLADGKLTEDQKKGWLKFGALPFENNLDQMVKEPKDWIKLVQVIKYKLEQLYPRTK